MISTGKRRRLNIDNRTAPQIAAPHYTAKVNATDGVIGFAPSSWAVGGAALQADGTTWSGQDQPQASVGEAQHEALCRPRCLGQRDLRVHSGRDGQGLSRTEGDQPSRRPGT